MGSVFAQRVVRYGILSHQRSFLFRHIDSDVGNDCCRLSAARPFAIATALPVLIVAWILAFSVQHIGSFYGKMQTVQKWLNRIVGSIFAIIGLYYCVFIKNKNMEIKVLGTGCAKCKTTYQTIEKVISENNLEDVKLTKVEDIVEILNSGIMATPAVVVDGAVKVKGHVPSEKEVKQILGI